MLSRLQAIGELGARIDAAIAHEISDWVLEKRYAHMESKRSKMWNDQSKYDDKLAEQYDEANQKKDELLAQAKEKFADYERTHADDKKDEDKSLLAELSRQHEEYKDKMQSLCDCYRGKLDDLKGEYDLRLLTIANTYEKEMLTGAHAKMEEILHMDTKSKHSQAVRDNYLIVKQRIDAKLQEALHKHRENINEKLLTQIEELDDGFEHWERLLYEEFLRYQYRWGGRQAREEYQREQERQQHEYQQRQREQQRREQQRQAHRRQAQHLTADELQRHTATLGLNADATLSEIKKSYRKLAKKYHPDKSHTSQDADAAKFIEVTEAYFILRDYFTDYK